MPELLIRAGQPDAALLRRMFGRTGRSPSPWVPHRLVVDAHVAAAEPDIAQSARHAGLPFLVDPQTYHLQDTQHPGAAWSRLPFATPAALTPTDLGDQRTVDDLVAGCIDYQCAAQATNLVAPYVHIQRTDSGWIDVQANLWRSTRRYLDRQNIRLGVLGLLAVGWRVLHPVQGREALLLVSQALRDLAPAEVGVAASKVHTGTRSEDRLVDLLSLVGRLSERWPVLMWQQGLLGEACFAAGAVGYETGIGWRERCDLQAAKAQHRSEPSPSARPGARPVYVDALRRSVPRRSLDVLREHRRVWQRLLCPDSECCPPAGEGLLADARQHTITRRARSLASLAAIPLTHWRWSQLADQAERSLGLSRSINGLAAADRRISRIDTAPMHAIQIVANHRRTQRQLRRPA